MKPQVLLLGFLLCACDSAAKPSHGSPAAPPVTKVAAPTEPPAQAEPPLTAAAKSKPDARGLRLRVVSAPAPAATVVEGVGELITIGTAPALIDLEDGTRVDAAPHTRLCAFARAKTLLLVSGQVHVTRLPEAERAGTTPARIASLAGTLETSPGADLALRVEVQGSDATSIVHRSQLGLSRGAVTWFGLDAHDALVRSPLSAGAPPPKPVQGMQWLSSDSKPQADKRSQAQRHVGLRAQDADRSLDAALTEQQALRDRGHALLARVSPRHAALAKLPADLTTPRDQSPGIAADSTRAYQRALVEHARLRQAQAEQLLLAAERSLLGALAGCDASSHGVCASLQAWSERFSARVASLL